jgi:hypothetical protein
VYRKTCGIKMALRCNLDTKFPQIHFEIIALRAFFSTVSNTVVNEKRNAEELMPIHTGVLSSVKVAFQQANKLSSGNHWAVESEIFWKARGDHG